MPDIPIRRVTSEGPPRYTREERDRIAAETQAAIQQGQLTPTNWSQGERFVFGALTRTLKEERQRQGLTLAQVAERSKIAESELEQVEAAGGIPSWRTLARYARSLGKRLEWTLVDAESPYFGGTADAELSESADQRH